MLQQGKDTLRHFESQHGLSQISPINDLSLKSEHFLQDELWRGEMINPRSYSPAEMLQNSCSYA